MVVGVVLFLFVVLFCLFGWFLWEFVLFGVVVLVGWLIVCVRACVRVRARARVCVYVCVCV